MVLGGLSVSRRPESKVWNLDRRVDVISWALFSFHIGPAEMENAMSKPLLALSAAALICASTQIASANESGTVTGAVGGAVAGAVVGGPVGAVVGGVGGAAIGNSVTNHRYYHHHYAYHPYHHHHYYYAQ
jgi:hypothetical protein